MNRFLTLVLDALAFTPLQHVPGAGWLYQRVGSYAARRDHA